jgi:hypothetical protein
MYLSIFYFILFYFRDIFTRKGEGEFELVISFLIYIYTWHAFLEAPINLEVATKRMVGPNILFLAEKERREREREKKKKVIRKILFGFLATWENFVKLESHYT